jgi:hypothetical protein
MLSLIAGRRLVLSSVLAQAVVSTVISFTSVAQGSRSGIHDARTVVVRSAGEWQTLWKAHDTEPPPNVDFSRDIVLGVFLGTRPTAGFGVRITAVTAKGTTAVVEFVESRPRAGAMTAQVLTSPFHLVTVPRQYENVEFRKTEK